MPRQSRGVREPAENGAFFIDGGNEFDDALFGTPGLRVDIVNSDNEESSVGIETVRSVTSCSSRGVIVRTKKRQRVAAVVRRFSAGARLPPFKGRIL